MTKSDGKVYKRLKLKIHQCADQGRGKYLEVDLLYILICETFSLLWLMLKIDFCVDHVLDIQVNFTHNLNIKYMIYIFLNYSWE